MSIESYTIYTSRSLDAEPGQPTGSSKLCLSCHDGTMALGSVFSRNTPILMAGGVSTMPVGPGHIGTDLADDHPISFRFDTSLATRDRKLRSPGGLPHEIKLDRNQELQCTTCHDVHNNAFGKFLVMRNTFVGTVRLLPQHGAHGTHRTLQLQRVPSVAHVTQRPVLKKQTVTATCTACHNGSVGGAADIASELAKVSVHDTDSSGPIFRRRERAHFLHELPRPAHDGPRLPPAR